MPDSPELKRRIAALGLGCLVVLTACGTQTGSLAAGGKSARPTVAAAGKSARPTVAVTGEPAPKDAPPVIYPSPPVPNRPSGLIAGADIDPYLAKTLSANNGFAGTDQETYYFILAGSPSAGSPVGQLLVETSDADADTGRTRYHRYTPPGRPHGSLTVTSGDLPIVTLRADDGTQLTFNVRTEDFSAMPPP